METTCIFCNLEDESIKHLFYDCIFTQMFWIDIEYLIFKFIKLKMTLSGKYIFLLYKNNNLDLEQNLVINLILMYGKYHIHKQKWSNNKPSITLFKIELKHYIEDLKDLRNKKAKRIYRIIESFSYGNVL